MKKSYIIILVIGLIISLVFNVFQYEKIKDYKERTQFYDEAFIRGLNDLRSSFKLYNGPSLSNESAIKNSITFIVSLEEKRPLTSYKNNKYISEMLHNLNKFFVLNSNDKINSEIEVIDNSLRSILLDLNDNNKINNFIIYLRNNIKF